VLVVLTLRVRRRLLCGPLLTLLLFVMGCGQAAEPVVRLTATFREPILVSRSSDVETALLVRNEGDVPIRLFKVDGGCSCRQIDCFNLGLRPARVFLRCPDESVELTGVVSAPEGIKAVVSSTRELTVMLDDDAPGIIDGVVEVATTAEGRGPLRIPIVRYAPGTDSRREPRDSVPSGGSA
jgi:hypothetical protein